MKTPENVHCVPVKIILRIRYDKHDSDVEKLADIRKIDEIWQLVVFEALLEKVSNLNLEWMQKITNQENQGYRNRFSKINNINRESNRNENGVNNYTIEHTSLYNCSAALYFPCFRYADA